MAQPSRSRTLLSYVLLSGFLLGAVACSQEGSYSLSISFPDDYARESVNQVSVQALETSGRTCQELLDGDVDPNTLLERSGQNIDYPPMSSNTLTQVPAGNYLFWVRGLQDDATLLRGCAAGRVRDDAHVEVRITLDWLCRPHPDGEQPLNGTDDDCDGLTDECIEDEECDNGNFCTIDQCISGFCSHSTINKEGTSCDQEDGDPCTVDSICVMGVCEGQAKDCSHLDSACMIGTCNLDGSCQALPRANGTSCEDGFFCTTGDACLGGSCVDFQERNCDDGDPCTLDICLELERECDHVNQPNPGAEGPPGDASCSNGLDDDCDGLSDLDDSNCFDCTENSTCDDLNPCTTDSCEDSICVNQPLPDGQWCDDERACTINDHCEAGVCASSPQDCSHLDDACNRGVCEQASGECQGVPFENGTPCEDGAYCTEGDSCQNGLCDPGQTQDCADSDPCTVDSCDEENDTCLHVTQPIPGAEGPFGDANCADGLDNDCDGLTDLDDVADCFQCSADSDCDDGLFCTNDACQDSACVYDFLPEGTDCENDGLFCTHEQCDAGGICQTEPRDCSQWSNDCFEGLCSEALETCVPDALPEGDSCGDTYCNGLSFMQPTCDSSQQCSVASTITICEDGDRCTEDACNAMGGCEYQPVTGCTVQTGDLADYAVAGDGSIFTVQTTSDRVLGRCYLPNGNPRTIEFDVSSGSVASVEPGGTQVLSARDTGISLVSFVLRDTAGDTNTRIFVSQLYDADCQKILATPIFWPAPISPNLYFDTAMDAAGNFALLWQNAGTNSHTFLTLYDSAGNRIGPEGHLVNNANQCSSAAGFHVALRPDGSGGVVTCQLSGHSPIRYRRFDAGGNFLDGTDSSMPELANTSSNNSSAYWTHQIAINDNDVIAVEWQNQYDYTYELDLLDADGSLRAHRVLGTISSNAIDGFKAFHQKVALLGNDFILRDNESPVTLYRVDQDGQLLGCDRLDYLNTSLRSSGSVLHMLDGDRVVRDVVNFDSWLGCAPSGCGNGGPDPYEGCDDGNLLSFDGCSEFCDIEACGDGVVTGLETCDDGNFAPNDGCDPLCQLQDPQAPDEPILGPADDFDVAADGRMITARLENGTIFATCYAPDKSLLRARFPLARGRIASPQVVMSRNGTLSLVAWRDLTTHKIMGSWLGPQCQLFHHSRELLSSESYSYTIAMDDQNRAAAMVGNHLEGMRLALFGPLGVRIGSELIQNCGGTSRGHLALNQASGGGVISCARSSDHFSFRRFDASANWVDAGLRDVDVVLNDMEVGGGPAVGMNDLGQFVFQWRSYDEHMHAEFFDSDGSFIQSVLTSMKQRELWGPYDTFALYQGGRMEIPLSGNNFVLGEIFTMDTSDKSCEYSMFTPFGLFQGSFETDLAMPFINTARMDEQGFIYFRKNQSVHFLDSPF